MFNEKICCWESHFSDNKDSVIFTNSMLYMFEFVFFMLVSYLLHDKDEKHCVVFCSNKLFCTFTSTGCKVKLLHDLKITRIYISRQ